MWLLRTVYQLSDYLVPELSNLVTAYFVPIWFDVVTGYLVPELSDVVIAYLLLIRSDMVTPYLVPTVYKLYATPVYLVPYP